MRLLLLTSFVFFGCASDGDASEDAPDIGMRDVDAAGSDAPTSDAGTPPPQGANRGVPATTADVLNFGEPAGDLIDGENSDPLDRATCFDGEDNDGTDGADCDDIDCRELGSCCVGSGECCSPVTLTGLPSGIGFDDCASFDECFAGAPWRFIGTAASLSDDGFAPEGSAESEGGVVLETPIDFAAHAVRLQLEIVPPEDCGAGCIESMVVAVTEQAPEEGAGVTVPSDVALQYSGGRDVFSILLEDHELARIPRGSATLATLVLRPTGDIVVELDGSDVWSLGGGFDPRTLQVVLHGRTRNPGATEMRSVALRSFVLTGELCDMPTAWGAREILPLTGTSPSIARGDAVRVGFVDVDGNLVFAEEAGDGTLTVLANLLDHTTVDAAVRDEVASGVKALDDPELVYEDGTWVVYFTAIADDESTWIGRAVEVDDVFVPDSAPVLDDASAPTLAVSENGTAVMVARRGDSLIALTNDAMGWVELSRSLLGEVVDAAGAEFGAASLVQHNRAWHLYVPIRRGARWSIQLFASDEMLAWRHVGDALPASGQGFDRLGTNTPDVLAEGDALRLVYMGDDGVRQRIGHARRTSTTSGSF